MHNESISPLFINMSLTIHIFMLSDWKHTVALYCSLFLSGFRRRANQTRFGDVY